MHGTSSTSGNDQSSPTPWHSFDLSWTMVSLVTSLVWASDSVDSERRTCLKAPCCEPIAASWRPTLDGAYSRRDARKVRAAQRCSHRHKHFTGGSIVSRYPITLVNVSPTLQARYTAVCGTRRLGLLSRSCGCGARAARAAPRARAPGAGPCRARGRLSFTHVSASSHVTLRLSVFTSTT